MYCATFGNFEPRCLFGNNKCMQINGRSTKVNPSWGEAAVRQQVEGSINLTTRRRHSLSFFLWNSNLSSNWESPKKRFYLTTRFGQLFFTGLWQTFAWFLNVIKSKWSRRRHHLLRPLSVSGRENNSKKLLVIFTCCFIRSAPFLIFALLLVFLQISAWLRFSSCFIKWATRKERTFYQQSKFGVGETF